MTLRSPDALVCAIPYLLGFEPRESAVLVWLSRGRILLTQRIDLPGSIDELPAWREATWSHAAASQSDELIAVVFAAATDLTGEGVSDVIREADARSIAVRDALRVEGDRWWSLLCSDSDCCPDDGRKVDLQVKDRVAAEFTLLGRAPLADRSAVAATLESDPIRVSSVAECLDDLDQPDASGVEAWRDAAIESLVRRLTTGSETSVEDPAQTARMLASLADIRVRDTLLWDLAQLDSEGLASALDRMIPLLRAAPCGTVAPVATCCAVLAWLLGDGARAMMAVDRALADDPDYSLAALVATSLRAGLAPTAWREVMAALPRDECRHGSR